MADPTNAQIAAALDELGDLYELDGAVSYRVIAYRNAAKAVRESSVSIMAMTREGRVTTVPGIGKTLEEKLRALDETGDIPALVKLRAKFPTGLIEVMHLPGFGPKRARKLYDELGVDSLDALRAAVEAGTIKDLQGLRAQGPGAAQADAGRPRRGRRAGAPRGALEGDPDRRGGAGGPARASRQRPRRGGGLAAPPRRLRQGPRHHRHRLRPEGARAHARRDGARRVRAELGRRRRARDHPHRA